MTGERVVIYVLATPDDPGLNAKQRQCALVCKSQGWEVVKHVRERNPDRPKLVMLADKAAAGGFDRVLFHSWDCIAPGSGSASPRCEPG